MPKLNPFIYGKPVPPAQHINRQRELRTLFSRLRNGESTAIVGEPRIGKTSLLHYLATPSVQQAWLGGEADQLITMEIDLYTELLGVDKTPQDFWRTVLNAVKLTVMDEAIQKQISLVEDNQYGSATLKNFFRNLGRRGWRVALLLDEFDALLTHPHFSTAEFLGGLRSIAIGTNGLQIITASIMSVSEMNRRSEASNPLGSPFFNNLTEEVLEPFAPQDVDALLDAVLAESGIRFTAPDRDYINWLSGRHPFRVQAAGAAMFDAKVEGLDGEERYAEAGRIFYERTSAQFDALWRRYLDDNARTVMVILSLVELGGVAQTRRFSFGEIEQPKRFAPELKQLAKMGLVEQVGNDNRWQWEHLLLWQGERWRVSSGGFVWWVADEIISRTRHIPNFEDWLTDKEKFGYLVTREQIEQLKELAQSLPPSMVSGTTALVRQFVQGFLANGENGG